MFPITGHGLGPGGRGGLRGLRKSRENSLTAAYTAHATMSVLAMSGFRYILCILNQYLSVIKNFGRKTDDSRHLRCDCDLHSAGLTVDMHV